MAELQYIFDEDVDKDMEEFMGPKWWRKDVYQRGPALVFLEHMKYPDEAEFTIRQKGSKKGTVKVLYSKPSEAEENELNSYADDIIKILEKHVVNREQIGEEVTRMYSEKTGQSGKPGTGPANTIRRFLNVQPPKKKKSGGSRKRGTRRRRQRTQKGQAQRTQKGQAQRTQKGQAQRTQKGGQVAAYERQYDDKIGSPDGVSGLTSIDRLGEVVGEDFPPESASQA